MNTKEPVSLQKKDGARPEKARLIPVEKILAITPLQPGTPSVLVNWADEESLENAVHLLQEHIVVLDNGLSALRAKKASGEPVDPKAQSGLEVLRQFKGMQHHRMEERLSKVRRKKKHAQKLAFETRFLNSAQCLLRPDEFQRIVEDAKKETPAPAPTPT